MPKYDYMIPVYAFLVKCGIRNIDNLPEDYKVDVAIYLASEAEK